MVAIAKARTDWQRLRTRLFIGTALLFAAENTVTLNTDFSDVARCLGGDGDMGVVDLCGNPAGDPLDAIVQNADGFGAPLHGNATPQGGDAGKSRFMRMLTRMELNAGKGASRA